MNNRINLEKPKYGAACNGCGYCCTVGPCQIAQDFLHCSVGPCVALEIAEGRVICGMVRNPLGYLFKATHPDSSESVLNAPPDIEASRQLSGEIASALGINKGCDADDVASAFWQNISINKLRTS